MNTLSRRINSAWLIIAIVSMVIGCSITDEKEVVEEPIAADSKPAAAGEPKEEAPKPAQPEPVKEEPVVEVMPGAAKEAELKVEPIPEPKVEETPTEEEVPPAAETTVSEPETEAVAAEESAAPKIEVPVSTGPDHFVITTKVKDSSHPHFGKGHKMGFLVNNEQGKEVVLERGKTYRFDVATDPKHDVYISLKEIGWGSTPYSEGIQGMYTYKGTMTVKPTEKTPDLLFYSCRNHPWMGGKIHIINPGEKVKIAKRTAAKPVAEDSSGKQKIGKADVNQKIMFANMLLTSKNSKAIAKSNITEAKDLYKKAEQALASARSQLKEGNNSKAYKSAENAIALLKKSSKLVPNESQIALMKERNKELLTQIKDFEESHKENYERMVKKQGKDAAVDYDKGKVAALKKEAAEFAKKGDYGKSNKQLKEAEYMITAAIHKMLDKQTIVYDLKFESAEEEYEYERKRFHGYYELIPIAVEQKQPKEGAKKLMESFVKKGKDLHDRAVKKAKEGDFPTAIAMLQDATKDVRRGLRMIGVSQ